MTQDFTFEQLFEHLQTLIADKDFEHGMNGLYDFSLVEHVNGDLQALLKTAETMEDRNQILVPARVAIIVESKIHNLYKIFQGYCIMASDAVVSYQLFSQSNYQDALDYLGLTEKPIF